MTVGTGTVGRVAVDWVLNTEAFDTGLQLVEDKIRRSAGTIAGISERIDRSLTRIGTRLTLGITVPAAGMAVALARTGAAFDQTMTRIGTLANATEGDIKKFRGEVLRLAPALAQTPTNLSQALLTITSAGVRGAQALDVLERSGKAATVGLGSTEVVARLVSAALQAYGSSGLTAGRATDILVAAVQAGAAEADEMAGSLGAVIGIASQVGVSFEQVAAFVATFTKLGVDANEAVTALRGALTTILSPSEQAEQALRAVGLSSEILRQQIRDKGLTETFIGLVQAFKGNEQGLTNVIENVRALSGVLGTAGAQRATFREVLGEITNSAGALDTAFARTAETPAFTFRQFRIQAETTATVLGDKLAPAFARVLRALDPVLSIGAAAIRIFAALPTPIQSTAIALAAMAVAAGPLILLLQGLVKVIGSLVAVTLLIRLGPILLQIVRATAPAVQGLVGLRAIIAGLPSPISAAASAALTLVSAFAPFGFIIGPVGALAARLIQLHPTIRLLGLAAVALGVAIGGIGIATKGLSGSSADASGRLDTMAESIKTVGDRARETKTLIERLNEEANRSGTGQPIPTPEATGGPTPVAPPIGGFYSPPPTPGPFGGAPTPTPTPPQVPLPLSALALPKEPVKSAAGATAAAAAASIASAGADNQQVTQTFKELSLELAALDDAAKFLPPTFDLVGAKAGAIETALKKAATEGLKPTSVEGQKLAGELAALGVDTTQLDRRMTAIGVSGQIAGDSFGAWQQQVGELDGQIQKLISDGIDPADPAIGSLEGRLQALLTTGPPVENALAEIAAQGAAVGPTFDVAGRSVSFLQGALATMGQRGLDPGSEAMVLMQREATRLAGDTSQLAFQLEAAAQQGLVLGRGHAVLQDETRLAETALKEMSAALTAARFQLGETDPAVLKLEEDVAKLRDVWMTLSDELAATQEIEQTRKSLVALDEQLVSIGQRASLAKQFSVGGFGGPTNLDVDLGAAGERNQARQSEITRITNLPPPASIEEGTARQQAVIDLSRAVQGETEAIRAAENIQAAFDTVADSITQAFDRSALGVIQGTTTIQAAFANLGQSMLLSWGSALVQKGTMTAAHWAAEQAVWLAGELGLISITATGEATKTGLVAAGSTERQGWSIIETGVVLAQKAREGISWLAIEAAKRGSMLVTAAVAIASAVKSGVAWVGSAIVTGIAWAITSSQMIAYFAVTAAEALVNALIAAYGWIAAAAAAAASAVASIPYVGPILAVIAAAAVVGGLTALVLSVAGASKGADITSDQLLYVHKGEMVLPPTLAKGVRSAVSNGGFGETPDASTRFRLPSLDLARVSSGQAFDRGGQSTAAIDDGDDDSIRDMHLHVHATDAKSVQRLFDRNGAGLARTMRNRARSFDRNLLRILRQR